MHDTYYTRANVLTSTQTTKVTMYACMLSPVQPVQPVPRAAFHSAHCIAYTRRPVVGGQYLNGCLGRLRRYGCKVREKIENEKWKKMKIQKN